MTVDDELRRRGIVELLHFTTNRGLVGILACQALMSRYRLPEERYLEHVLHVNAATRPEASAFFDKSQNWLDYVNLSLSEINSRYFIVSQRWHLDKDVWWAILSFESALATHSGVVFTTTNNSYDLCTRASGLAGFDALFAPIVRRKRPSWVARRAQRDDDLPTCEQAEVLYPGVVPATFLRRVYVQNDDHHDVVSGWLAEFGFPDVEVVPSVRKFAGMPN